MARKLGYGGNESGAGQILGDGIESCADIILVLDYVDFVVKTLMDLCFKIIILVCVVADIGEMTYLLLLFSVTKVRHYE